MVLVSCMMGKSEYPVGSQVQTSGQLSIMNESPCVKRVTKSSLMCSSKNYLDAWPSRIRDPLMATKIGDPEHFKALTVSLIFALTRICTFKSSFLSEVRSYVILVPSLVGDHVSTSRRKNHLSCQ